LSEPFIYQDESLYAEYGYVEQLEKVLQTRPGVPIAIGSGTINDLTKLASHRCGRPYFCIPTAASMDGYTAFGASITHLGSKQTFQCPAPRAVLADLEIIRGAPSEMNAWGYADLLAKVTAGADWILADHFGEEPIQPEAWRVVQGGLREMVADPAEVRARDAHAIGNLVEGLMLAGFGMQSAQSSRAASGAEHQFSHLWDMQHHTHNGTAPSHGFKVGIGTLAVTALYEELFRYPMEQLDVNSACKNWRHEKSWESIIREQFPEAELRETALKEMRAKSLEPDRLRKQMEHLRHTWPELKSRLENQLFSLAEIKSKLVSVGAPTQPEQIGITRERLRASFLKSFFIRRRFTVLDVVMRTGLMEKFLANIFGESGPWPISPRAFNSNPT
jgi:glycerol-1-phosphate dehydrogenase [NAD(P)+]